MNNVQAASQLQPASSADRRIAALRLIVLFALLPLLWWDVIPPESELALTGLTALLAGYILVTLVLAPHLRSARRQDLLLTADILAAAAVVYFTGGIKSTVLLLLYLPVLAAAVRFDLRQTILSAIAVSAIVVWMWNFAEGGLPSLGPVAARAALFTLGSLFIAFFFGSLAQETKLSKARAALNRMLDTKLAEATEELRRRLADLEFSYDLTRRLAGTSETSAVLEAITEVAQQQMNAPFSAVFLYERLGKGLSLAHARGLGADEAAPMMHACAEWLAEGFTKPAMMQAPDDSQWTRGVCAPIVASGRLLGAACAGGDDAWETRDEAWHVLGGIADQGGVALERAYLLEDLQRLALADPTARLYARDQLDRILREEVRRATQLEAPFTLMKVKIDNPQTNAAPAAVTADLLLKHVAARILESARRIDVVARGNRGELFILLPMTAGEAARRFAMELRQRLVTEAAAPGLLAVPGGLDIRIGIAAFPQDASTGPELHVSVQHALDVAHAGAPVVRAGEQPPAGDKGDHTGTRGELRQR